MSALETLNLARAARGAGDVDRCVMLSAAALQDATDESDGETAWNAAIAPGRAYLNRGEASESLGYFRWALDVAGKMGLVRHLAPSYSWLHLASREAGNEVAARRFAATSLDLFRDFDARSGYFAGLVADMALHEFERKPTPENAAHAVQCFRAAPHSIADPFVAFLSAANVMRASAVLGLRCRYEPADEALDFLQASLPSNEGVALVLVQAATGAVLMREYERGAVLAERAERLGEQRDEPHVLDRIREVKDAALAERAVAA
jgi:tetratricopeptide (TPR) repeat protein